MRCIYLGSITSFTVMLCRLLALSLLCLFAALAWAQKSESASRTPPSFNKDQRQLELLSPIGVLVVPSEASAAAPKQSIEPPLAAQFTPWLSDANLPTSKQTDVWLRLELPQQNPPRTWVLRIPRVSLYKATLYERDLQNPKAWKTQVSGIAVPNALWPSRARTPQFELTTRTDQTQTIFVLLQHDVNITEEIQLVSSNDSGLAASMSGSIYGAFIGVFSMLAILGLASWWMFKNPHFGWLALLSVSVMVAVLALNGFMNLRIWPHTASLTKPMMTVFPLLAAAVFVRFVISITYMKDLSRPLLLMSWAAITLCFAAVIYVIYDPFATPRLVIGCTFSAALITAVYSVAHIAWRSQPWLWAVVLSLVPMLFAVLSRVAYGLGWDAPADLISLFIVLATGVGLVAIYVILVNNQLKRRNVWGYENLREMRDASTRLWTRHVAMIRLKHFIARSKRFDQSCGVVMVRWNDFQEIFKNANAITRGSILSELGLRLSRLGREIDTVARYDDNHFMYLVEAPISEVKIGALATKILASCMRPFAQNPESRGFDVHVAVWLYSQSPCEPNAAIKMLLRQLEKMPEGTQRRVRFVNTSDFERTVDAGSRPDHAKEIVKKINAIEQSHAQQSFDEDSMPYLQLDQQKTL